MVTLRENEEDSMGMIYCITCTWYEKRSVPYPVPDFQNPKKRRRAKKRTNTMVNKKVTLRKVKQPPQEYRPPIPLERSPNWM